MKLKLYEIEKGIPVRLLIERRFAKKCKNMCEIITSTHRSKINIFCEVCGKEGIAKIIKKER